MKPLVVLSFATLVLASGMFVNAQEKATTPEGIWEGEWVVEGGIHSGKRGTILLTITSVQGGKLKGALELTGLIHNIDGPVTGKIKGNEVTVDRWPLPYGTLTLHLSMTSDTMEGSFSYGTMSNHLVSLKRKK